jgi:hypothetical protein
VIAAKRKINITNLKAQLSSEFEMKDLGAAKKILGMEITLVCYFLVNMVTFRKSSVVLICITLSQ